jgi:hypothetical protein
MSGSGCLLLMPVAALGDVAPAAFATGNRGAAEMMPAPVCDLAS